jgi:hypothetical protein
MAALFSLLLWMWSVIVTKKLFLRLAAGSDESDLCL